MVSVLHENDQHSRLVLTLMLQKLGFHHVHGSPRMEESLFFLEHEPKNIGLILTTFHEGNGFDFPMSRLVKKLPDLNTCPLIVLTESWKYKTNASSFSKRLSRVDQVLSRPFGIQKLKETIAHAFENRAKFREVLLFLGSKVSALKLEGLILSEPTLQWKKLVSFQDPDALLQYVETNEPRLGGILFELTEESRVLANPLKKFKRSRLGRAVPLACMGQNPALLAPFRTYIDLCFQETKSLSFILNLLSERSLLSWGTLHSLRAARDAFKQKKTALARRRVERALSRDPNRWELLILAGKLAEKPELIKRALDMQPCAPDAYLSLLPLVNNEERASLLEKSSFYCPAHPGLAALRK